LGFVWSDIKFIGTLVVGFTQIGISCFHLLQKIRSDMQLWSQRHLALMYTRI
jgi:hypothetical protein